MATPIRTRLNILDRRGDAQQHCRTCPNAGRVGNSSVDCDGVLRAYANGLCPRGLWDHSAKIEHKPGEWPLLARIVAKFKADEDKGVGDTIHRMLGPGGEWQSARHHAGRLERGATDAQQGGHEVEDAGVAHVGPAILAGLQGRAGDLLELEPGR